jgi:hypothetical protein
MRIKKLFTSAILMLCILTPINFIYAQSDWRYDAGLYGWFAGLEGTIGLANQQEEFQASVGDLLENLTFSAGGHIEARNPELSFILDIFYAGLSVDAPPVTVGDSTFTPNGSVDTDEWILEGSFGYRAVENLEVLMAVRYFIMESAMIQDDNTLASASVSWPAFYLGARYSGEFADNLYGALRGDIGYGGDGFAWFVTGTLGYRFSNLFSLALSYRMLNMVYEDGSGIDYIKYDANTYGFGLAGVFSF